VSGTDDVLDASYAGTLGRFSLDAAFRAPLCGVTAIFGPSGSGKTVILRCIAGLTHLRGHLAVGREEWENAAGLWLPPHARRVGYVFQEPSLFAHLSVRENLLYGHRRAVRRGAEVIRVDDVIALLGIAPLLERAPLRLSGGERQRVAIGRALLSQPRLLLMDEPLSALDRMSKDDILPYLDAVQRALTLPVLYVTHDMEEVERLADHIVLIERGRVIVSGPLGDVLADPRTPFARGPSAATVLDARLEAFDPTDAMTTLAVDGGRLLVPGAFGAPGTRHRLRIAAHDVSLAVDPPSRTTILNVLHARIESIESLDAARVNVVLALGDAPGGARVLARITRRSRRALALAPGQRVHAQVKAASIVDPRRTAPPQATASAGDVTARPGAGDTGR
jgi:molybdate transport system ATP-binding protein